MATWKKTLLIIAAVCVALGAVIVISALAATRGDWRKLNTANMKFEEVTTEITEPFTGIRISDVSNDVRFLPSEDGKCTIVAWDSEELYHIIDVQGDTLTVKLNNHAFDNGWFHVSFGSTDGAGTLTVYLPADEYADLTVETVSGDILLPSGYGFESGKLSTVSGDVVCSANISGSLDIDTTSGEVTVQGVTGESLFASTTSGDITLTSIRADRLRCDTTSGEMELRDVVIADNADLDSVSGDIELDGFDAGTIQIDTISGEVEGAILTPKRYDVDTTSGEIRVPQSDPDAGLCRIDTMSGDVEIKTP